MNDETRSSREQPLNIYKSMMIVLPEKIIEKTSHNERPLKMPSGTLLILLQKHWILTLEPVAYIILMKAGNASTRIY